MLSPTDEVVICTHKPDPTGKNPKGFFWDNGSFHDLDDAVAAIQRYDNQQEMTVYYSVGKFANHQYISEKTGKTRHHRYQHLATSFKTLALDLDCGPDKPYATQKDGWTAMVKALRAIGLPMPMVVASGNGIHCYWPLVDALPTDAWVEVSMALRLALEEHGVEIDTSKIHDPSMVLRPVGSHHKKQTPHKEVKCMADCPDYDIAMLRTTLSQWIGRMPAKPSAGVHKAKHTRSAAMSAVLDSGDINLEAVAASCAQVGALVASGGAKDAAGRATPYPVWILGLQLARKTVDPEAAVVSMGQHYPNFDLQESLDKMNSFEGGVPFCATWENACPTGCAGCPRKGTITNPGQLNRAVTLDPPPGMEEIKLPEGYFVEGGKVWMDEEQETTQTAADGKKVKVTALVKVMICPYEMHITGVYTDHEYTESTATLAVRYPLGNWKEHELPLSMLAVQGRDFAAYMINKQVYFMSNAVMERTRTFLMRYLDMVQQQSHTGTDFVAFGWQEDGSFLCGESLLGTPTGNVHRRLKGPAARYGKAIVTKGDRELWADATAMLDMPEANNIASAIMFSGVGVFGKAAGNACGIISYFSTETTTGKTLCLHAANSTFGDPRLLLLGPTDTANAIYRTRGTLNNLVATIDELTTLPSDAAVDLAYNFSEGREKLSLTQARELREPAIWQGPTLISCNSSLHGKYAEVMSQNSPVRVRTLELIHDDKTFVELPVRGGRAFFDAVHDNFGFFIPELVDYVIANGGQRKIWDAGSAAFDKKFQFAFEGQERFYRTDIIGAWITGMIGKKLGLIRFDVDRVIRYLLDRVTALRTKAIVEATDAFDTVGQFLQEHHDKILFANEEYVSGGKGKEVVQYPVPQTAVARLTLVSDASNPVMPGSRMAINTATFKKWLSRNRDSFDRIINGLHQAGALSGTNVRVTMYKGCHGQTPAQAFCFILNINHPRFANAFAGGKAYQPSPVALAVLQGGATP